MKEKKKMALELGISINSDQDNAFVPSKKDLNLLSGSSLEKQKSKKAPIGNSRSAAIKKRKLSNLEEFNLRLQQLKAEKKNSL